MAQEVRLFTPLSPEQVVSRMQAEVTSSLLFAKWSDKPLEGRVTTENMVLFKKIYYNNSSRLGLYATLQPYSLNGKNGTLIYGSFSTPTHERFLGVAIPFIMFLIGLIHLFHFLSSGTGDKFMFIFPIAFGVLFVGISRLFNWFSRGDPEFIRKHLIQALQAVSV